MNKTIINAFPNAGLALRLVIGWTYFSAFWRRLILENKLDPEVPGYIGEKFNHFLPNALFIKPLIEYLVSNPEILLTKMWIFTIVEGLVGLFLMVGFKTRINSLIIMSLALGILLGSGWIGTTCLDEWQIGILGIAGGFTLFQLGGGKISIDGLSKNFVLNETKFNDKLNLKFYTAILVISFLIFGLTLYTNQAFHGGVYGELHNKSVKPKLEITNLKQDKNQVSFDVMRIEGADVYGSFLIRIDFFDQHGNNVKSLDMEDLRKLDKQQIKNYYVAKIKPHKHSLLLPLGAKANLSFEIDQNIQEIILTDISGIIWKATMQK